LSHQHQGKRAQEFPFSKLLSTGRFYNSFKVSIPKWEFLMTIVAAIYPTSYEI
jgi:hypothetical protein